MTAALPPPPKLVPTLTDVVGFSLDAETASGQAVAVDAPESSPQAPPRSADVMQLRPLQNAAMPDGIDENELAQRVLADVQRQIDRMFEYRMRESVGPVFARLLDAFLIETREELNKTLHDVVRRAVAQELARHRPR
ncbi:hypothetical protein [Leptothrix discophora]|uniref:Uncharacterized protein n=1 Tax=Leptothrix discophora TaxID=89 RepID=A0ABT9G207_LEPDI|nr:hypothetical protein [Leptothrix discophora]MDP4300520.1 hypothetical protein [Leptothrix discophora]